MRLLPSLLALSVGAVGCGSAAGRGDGGARFDLAVEMGPPPSCGDGVCDATESCATCPADCGACPACPYAPECPNGALPPPAQPRPRDDLDLPTPGPRPDGGVPSIDACETPRLRLRLAQVAVRQGSGALYCLIDASDGVASEFALSPKTPSLASGQSYAFDPSVAIFWGQAGAHPTMDNLTITYNCFLVVSDAWQSALQAAANAAAMIGGMAGQYGWAFGLASAAASTAAAALQATSGDMQRLNVQQTIGRSDLLDLAGGRTWTIEAQRSGSDLVLTVESWGCAAGRPR